VKQLEAPAHKGEKYVLLSARIGESIEAVCHGHPKCLLYEPKLGKSFRLRAGLPLAFVPIFYSKTEVPSFIEGGVEKASNTFMTAIQIPQGPTMEANNGDEVTAFPVKGFRVLPKDPFDHVFVLDMFVTGRSNWWATGKTCFFLIRSA
jgi:hypothetical protein